MMKSYILGLLAATLIPLAALSEPIKMGVVLPLTGKAAPAGEAVRNSAVLANSDLGSPFELLFEDNGLDSARTVASVRKLIDIDKVKSLIVFASGPSNTAAPIAEAAQIPMIGLSVDPNVSGNRNWVMIHWASNEKVASKLLSESQTRKLKRLAVVTTQVQGLIDLEKTFLERAKGSEFEVIFDQQLLPTETDFKTTVLKIKLLKPEAVFVNLYYGQVGNFALECAKQNFAPQFFGQFVLDDEAELAVSQGALNGAFFANTSAGDLSFDRDYAARFGKRPGVGAVSTYDAIAIFAEAFRESAGTAAAINKYIHALHDFSGKAGTYSALPSNSFDVPAGIGEIRGGKVLKFAAEKK